MKPPPVKPLNLVFDLGQVLISWQPLSLLRLHLPTHCHDETSASAWAQKIFHSPDWLAFDAGRASMDEVVQRTALRTQLPEAALHKLVQDIPRTLRPIEASIQVLAQLRDWRDLRGQASDAGLRLYFLSNMPAPYALELRDRYDFFNWFDGGVFSGLVRLAKPEAAIFEHTQTLYGLAPEHTAFIDDHKPNIDAARVHGWRAAHLPEPHLLGQVISDLMSAKL